MERITIVINTVNAAFKEQGNERVELSRILHEYATKLIEGASDPSDEILDINGNVVGYVTYN